MAVLVTGVGAQPAPGFTELDSISSADVQGNFDSELPAVSADGRFVAFVSLSDNLVPGDTNGASDIFVRDRLTGTTERVSVSSTGAQSNGNSGLLNGMGGPSISADGRYVAFDSEGSNLVKGDTNGAFDVFVHDRSAGTTVRVSDAPDRSQGNNWSFSPDLDAIGHVVVFDTFATNLGGNPNATVQVFLRDLDTGVLQPISAPPGSTDQLEQSENGRVSPDGRFVLFDSQSTEFLPRAIVLFDRTTGTREVESVNDSGVRGNDNSSNPVVSADGRFVSYTSFASNLVADDTNFRLDVFVRDRQAGTTRRVSVGSNGAQGDLDSLGPAIDADGAVIAYFSASSTFVPESGQSFFAYDIFVRDARPPADLSLTISDAPDPATVRGTLTYTAMISNAGPTNATGVTLVADLPTDANFVSASGAVCSRQGKGKSNGTLTCAVGTVAAGSSATVTIMVQPTRPGTLSLAADAYADQPDPNRANNRATATTTV